MDNMKNYFCSPAMDRLLSQHILRVDEMPHVGLYGGKLGLIILLYHYAHFNRNKPYKELADRLMESSLVIPSDFSYRFSDGLSGVGWGLLHLMRQGFVQIDEDVWHELDRRLMNLNRMQIQKEDAIDELAGLISYVEIREKHLSDREQMSSFSPDFGLLIKSLKQKIGYKAVDDGTVLRNIAVHLQRERQLKLTKSKVVFYPTHMVVKQNDGYIKLKYRDILSLRWEQGYTVIRLLSGKELLEDQSLKEIETCLPEYFCRINKKYILNLYHKQSVRHKNGEMIVVMQYDDELYTVARRRMSDFKNKWCGL